MQLSALEGKPDRVWSVTGGRMSFARTLMVAALNFFIAQSAWGQCFTDADCNDSNPCTDDTCICGIGGCPGICWNVSNCSDGQLCNGTELCCTTPGGCGTTPFGSCQPGTPIDCPPGQFCSESAMGCVECEVDADCDDGDACTSDACDTSNNCQYTVVPGGACDDGDACTENDVCDASGACAGTPIDCNEVAPLCHSGVCVSGTCQFIPQSDGTDCDDGDLCTAVDECQGGVCVGGPAGGCIDVELRAPQGPIFVGDIVVMDLYMTANGCPAPPPGSDCPVGTQAVRAIEAVVSWDPAFLEPWDPSQKATACIGDEDCPPEMFCNTSTNLCEGFNPEDPCDDLDPCNLNCGLADRYNWGSSLYPGDCGGDGINDPCTGIPGNDGDLKYAAFQQLTCNGNPAPAACVPTSGMWVSQLKFKAIAPTAGVASPTPIGIADCVLQTRTLVVDGESAGNDITGALAPPELIDIQCTSGADCPLGVCIDGSCAACLAPVVVDEASRYIEVTPAMGPDCAIFVRGVDPDVSCISGYVQADGSLGPTPFYQPPGPGGWDTVHVFGESIVGGMTYSVQADCDAANPGTSMSQEVMVTMWNPGDADGNGVVDIVDITRGVDGFTNTFYTLPCSSDADCETVWPHFTCDLDVGKCIWITMENVDITGDTSCKPNQLVTIVDIVAYVDFFQAASDPCNPLCP